MTAERDDRKARMTKSAAARTAPDAPPAGSTAIRTKPFRITLDLAPDDYAALNRWLTWAPTQIDPNDPRRISLARALRAAIHAMTANRVVSEVIVNELRRERPAQFLRQLLHYVTYCIYRIRETSRLPGISSTNDDPWQPNATGRRRMSRLMRRVI
jgi:hypothetical protein